jgi:TonB family protein
MRVLLVDHDSEGLEAVARAIRGVLELDCVTSKGDAMLLLRQNTYDVLIACERCVDGSGLDLLARTTRTATPLKRIFAAPTDRLQLLGPRLAPFKVQRTINYPIDLEELWLAIAQVTGTSDDTDGTIERVVLDERGIPSTGSVPRSPIPPRPPAPLREMRPAPPSPPAPAIAAGAGGRAAAARLAQAAPEPPLRPPAPPRTPPPPPRTTSDTGRMRAPQPPQSTSDTGRMRAPLPPRSTSDTGRMRAPAPPMQPIPPMPITPPPAAPLRDLGWTPEVSPAADDFAEIAAQARLGVQQKAVDEAARRKRVRLMAAGGVAVAVAASIVFLIETFYDPEARARERAIAQEVERMAEQQKVTDNLTRIEVDIESAIMENDFDAARASLAELVARSPEHPRRAFLQASIERAAELAKLEAQKAAPAATVAQAERPAPRRDERREERVTSRSAERASPANTRRGDSTTASNSPSQRVYGAPIGEAPRSTLPLDAPINAPATTSMRRAENAFPGRTVEASDSSVARTAVNTPATSPAPAQGSTQAVAPGVDGPSGSAVVSPLPAAPAPSPAAPAALDIIPAKLVKRVSPVAPANTPPKAKGQVVVQFEIGLNGKVSGIEVVESSPRGVFDDAVKDAVRKWVYEPRKENGVAVVSKGQARLVFEAAR